MTLQLCPDESPHLLHTLAIDAHIAVAGAGGGAEVNGLGFIVERKFDIVNEAEQQAREFVMQVRLVFFDELGAGQGTDDFLECLLRLSTRLTIVKWRDGMAFILGLGRDAIGAGGARSELFHRHNMT
jgi:hypothetical protein